MEAPRKLSTLLSEGAGATKRPRNTDLTPLRAAVARIEARWPDQGTPEPQDPEALVQDMRHRLAHDAWDGCSVSHVCAAARALFDQERRNRSDLDALRRFYYRETEQCDRPTLLNAMLAAYLDSFEPGASHTHAIAESLRKAEGRPSGRSARLLTALPQLLDPGAAVEAVTDHLVGSERPYETLVALGLQSPHAPGLMDHAHLCFVERLAPRLADGDEANRLLDWLCPKGKLARRSGAADAITAILHPWVRQDPAAQRLSQLTHRLVDMYGDPRRVAGDPWHNVGDAERAVFLRWLTGENLRLLFDAITDTNDSHMWAERREFYLGLHQQKRIDAAWVAFAPAGARQARAILANAGHGGGMEFGRQTAGGGRKNTSLLIARIGSKIVVDGSHSYKVHVFQQDDPRAPKLFQQSYDCEKIRYSLPESRKKSHHGAWQNWVEMRI